MRDDAELLRLYAVDRSNEAFAELVQRHIGSVYAVARRRLGGNAHLAEEVTQEVFADLARKAASLSQRETLVGWLFVAARFASAKAVRRDKQWASLHRKAEQMNEPESNSALERSWDEMRPVLDDSIHELNERDREVILLYFFDKRTYADIGAKLSITDSGARMRIERALEKMRISLGRRGITSTTAALTVALGGQAVAAVPGGLAASVTTAALAGAIHPSAAALLYLMSITKTQLAVVLGIVITGASIMGVVEQRKISTLLTQQNALVSESSANSIRISELSAKLAKAEAALAAARAPANVVKATAGSIASKTVTSAGAPEVTVIHMKDVLRDHPEMAALQRKELRRGVVREYARAITALNLPPDQATQLKNLLVEKAMTSADAMELATQAGLQPNSAEVGKAVAQATKDLDQSINSLIGSEANEKLEALKATTFFGSTNAVDEIAVDMEDEGVSLTADQSLALSQYLRDLSNPAKNPEAGTPGFNAVDPATWQTPKDQQFFAKAANILTPTQLQILKNSRSDSNQRDAIFKQYRGSGNGPVMITD